MYSRLFISFIVVIGLLSCVSEEVQRAVTVEESAPVVVIAPPTTAPLLDGIGPVQFPISTESERAQAYFNQALTFSYGFNHAEAVRSFTEAARLDPSCGICWWGVARMDPA